MRGQDEGFSEVNGLPFPVNYSHVEAASGRSPFPSHDEYVLDRKCSVCKAGPGVECTIGRGKRWHVQRSDAARRHASRDLGKAPWPEEMELGKCYGTLKNSQRADADDAAHERRKQAVINTDAAVIVFDNPALWRTHCDAEAHRLIARYTAVDGLIAQQGLTPVAALELANCDIHMRFLRMMQQLAEVDVNDVATVPDDPDGENPWANFK